MPDRERERLVEEMAIAYCSHRSHDGDGEDIPALSASLAVAEADFARRLDEVRGAKDGAYLERNRLVAVLARLFPSGLKRTDIPGWSDDWHGCVYIDLPTGQCSWHYHDSHAYLFDGLPPYDGEWDGHDTDEKYRRIAAIRARGRE